MGRPAHRGRPDPAPDARPGDEHGHDLRRRHHRFGVRPDRRPGRRGHADDLRTRAAQEPEREGSGGVVQGEGLRSAGIHALLLRRRPDHQAGGREGELARPEQVAEVMHSGMPFHTVIGDISFDKKGDRTTVDYVWYVWKKEPDGKIGFEQL